MTILFATVCPVCSQCLQTTKQHLNLIQNFIPYVEMEIKYPLFFAENIEDEISFLSGLLGFELLIKKVIHSDLHVSLLKSKADSQLMAVTSQHDYRVFKSMTVLQSNNCLRDFFSVKNSGINITRDLQYNPNGIAMEFIDGFNNLFIVLEEREYNLT